MMLVYRYF